MRDRAPDLESDASLSRAAVDTARCPAALPLIAAVLRSAGVWYASELEHGRGRAELELEVLRASVGALADHGALHVAGACNAQREAGEGVIVRSVALLAGTWANLAALDADGLAETALSTLALTAANGVRRPRSRERIWIAEVFGLDFVDRLEPDPERPTDMRPRPCEDLDEAPTSEEAARLGIELEPLRDSVSRARKAKRGRSDGHR